jgi:carbonic anhydrase
MTRCASACERVAVPMPTRSPFLPFRDVDQSVRDDLALYAASPLVRHDIPVRGFVYDVKTGRLREVKTKG